MQTINSIWGFLKNKKKILYIISAALLIIIISIFVSNKNGNDQFVVAKIGEFKNQVSVSGKVIPSTNVDLGFKNGGRIEKVYYSLDSSNKIFIKSGTIIAQVEAKEARKDLHDAEIDLENARLALNKLEIENSKENLSSDLDKAYDEAFIVISDAFSDTLPTIDGLKNILDEDAISHNSVSGSGNTALYYRDQAEDLYYKAKNSFEDYQDNFRNLTRDSFNSEIEKNLDEVYDVTKTTIEALKSTKNLVDYLSDKEDDSDEYLSIKNTLNQYISTMNNHLSAIPRAKTEIKNNQDTFLDTELDIRSLSLDIKQKENALQEARSILEDYYIRAPFDGLITKIDAKVGEIVSSDIPMVSMMGDGTFQIESYIPEISIALVSLGANADVTLDAYGESVIFPAKVISIDPAETIKDGVSTYKVKLIFEKDDSRVLSGMTANVLITAYSKSGVIVLPKGVIYEKDGKKFVQIKSNKNILEKEITTGETSSLGQVEVISGINEGDNIILSPKIN